MNCYIWGKTNILWKDANWQWSKCYQEPIPAISIGNPPGVDATTLIQPWMIEEPWNPYITGSMHKKKRLIKLVCKVKGKDYDEEKEIKNFDVKIGDIRMVVKAVPKINLDLKLEE